jgi:hypothetical protein
MDAFDIGTAWQQPLLAGLVFSTQKKNSSSVSMTLLPLAFSEYSIYFEMN